MENTSAAPPSPQVAQEYPGLGFSGLVKVFTSPADLFSKIKEDPKILTPYVALVVITGIFLYFVSDYMIQMQLNTEQMQQMMETQNIPRDQMAKAMVPWTIGGGMFAMALGPVIIALLAWFWGGFVFAGRAGFAQILSVSLFGEFLYMVGALAHLPMILAKGSLKVSYSLAAFVPNADLQSFTYQLLSKVSVFHIWELIVLGIGFSYIFSLPRNKAIWVSVLSMGLLSIVAAVINGLGA